MTTLGEQLRAKAATNGQTNGASQGVTMSQSEYAALMALVEAAKARNNRSLSFKVSGKGAVSVYGLQRFPVTLYSAQWQTLADAMPKLLDFMKQHVGELTTKD